MKSKRLEIWGNETTMNLNNIIYTNIINSPYYRDLGELTSFHEIIDEIYNHVSYLDPFATGSTPSSAFCILLKLWNMRLTLKQLNSLLDHTDSAYPRALGFLYLRYVCKPDQIWEWFSGYLEDDQEFELTKGPRPTIITIGKLCLMLLEDQKFLGTMLPRIPVPIAKKIEQSLSEIQRPANQSNEKRRSPSPAAGNRGSSSRRSRSPDRRRRRSTSRSRDTRRHYDADDKREDRRDSRSSSYRRRDDYYDDHRDSRRNDDYRRRSRSPPRSRYGTNAHRYYRD